MAKKRKRRPSWRKGYRAEIMKMLMSFGVITFRALNLMENKEMYRRKIKEMKKEGYIEEHKNKGNRALSLSDFDNKYQDYIGEYEMGYYGYHRRYCRTVVSYVTTYQKNYADFMAAVRDSEAAVFMHEAGAGALMEEKIQLRDSGRIGRDDRAYYRTAEIKDTWKDRENNSLVFGRMRCNGWLTCPGGNYMVYQVCMSQIRWFKTSEDNYAGYIKKLCRERKEGGAGDIREAVILAYTDEVFEKMVFYERQHAENLNVSNGHKTMYGLTYDTAGLILMRLMMERNWKKCLMDEYLYGLQINDSVSYSACNAYDGDVKILLFCIPDLVRLRIFMVQAADDRKPEKNRIYCFDTQEEFVKRIAGDCCEVRAYSLHDYMAKQNTDTEVQR